MCDDSGPSLLLLPETSGGHFNESDFNGDGRHNHSALMQSLSQPKNTSISVGNDYQVPIASMELCTEKKPEDKEYPDRDECLWRARNGIKNSKLIADYCLDALKIFNINVERSLLVLHCSNYNLDLARKKLARRTVIEQHFSLEDSYVFRNAYNSFGKQFNKIHQMMPHKSIYALIEHYYKTKKKQQYKVTCDLDSINNGYNSNEELYEIEKKNLFHDPVCENCKNSVNKVYATNGMEVCQTCRLFFRSTNQHRVCKRIEPPHRRPKCPPDMENLVEQFQEMAQPIDEDPDFEDADDSGDLQIAMPRLSKCQLQIGEVERDIEQTRAKACQLEKTVKEERKGIIETADQLVYEARNFLTETQNGGQKSRNSYQWTSREKLAAFHALIRFNANFQTVSEILGTKTPDMVKGFYSKYQKEIQHKILESKSTKKDQRDILSKEYPRAKVKGVRTTTANNDLITEQRQPTMI